MSGPHPTDPEPAQRERGGLPVGPVGPVGAAGPGSPLVRPWWATSMACFCAATLVFTAWRDLFVAGPRDVEVWFGFELRGVAAALSAPIHWAIFAVAAWGYWACRPWVWPWASCYALYIAASHVVWNLTSPTGGGAGDAAWQFALFSSPAIVLWWAKPPARTSEAVG